MTDAHNQTLPETPGGPYCGRGERRPYTARSARTNDPFRLPDDLHGQSPIARRWRDLAAAYSAQLGERVRREDVRARVRALIWLTLEIERLHDDRICNRPVNLQLLLHMSQETARCNQRAWT
jgi:hypothetical protein